MEQITLVEPNERRNGVVVRKTNNDIRSCELRKVALSGRDNGYIGSITEEGNIIIAGTSWRPVVNSPVPFADLETLVRERLTEIIDIIKSRKYA